MSGPPAKADSVNSDRDAIRERTRRALFLDIFHPPALGPVTVHSLLNEAYESVGVDRTRLSQDGALFPGAESGLIDLDVLEEAGVVRLIDGSRHADAELA